MLRDIIIFLAGAEAFHTMVHLFLPYMIKLPLETSIINLTPFLNILAILLNGVITVGLICLASRMKKTH